MTSTDISAYDIRPVPQGTICRCTVDDRPELIDLYRASYPEVPLEKFDLRDVDLPFWYAFKDGQGDIQIAMFVWNNGVVFVLAKPDDVESSVVRDAFVRLAKEIRESLGIADLTIFHSRQLCRLGDLLEQQGFLSKEVLVSRVMHFNPVGTVSRVS